MPYVSSFSTPLKVSTMKELDELRRKYDKVREENNDYVSRHNRDMARLHDVELRHETLKIQYDQLGEERDRLKKEVGDLKGMNGCMQFYWYHVLN